MTGVGDTLGTNLFPTAVTNPTIAQAAADPAAVEMLAKREERLEAAGYSVDRATGLTTVAEASS
jgi:hypothetical protein